MFFFALLLGVAGGIGLSLLINGAILNKSNNFGDSKATLTNFSDKGITFVEKKNRIKKDTPLDDIQSPEVRANLYAQNKANR